MAVVAITNPSGTPIDIADYQNQNRLIEANFTGLCEIDGDIDGNITSGLAPCSIKAGGLFEYNGIVYKIDADTTINFNVTNTKSINYLTFDGTTLAFTTTRPVNSWDAVRKGYYVGAIKYLDAAVVQFYRGNFNTDRINGFQLLRHVELGKKEVQEQGEIPPEYKYWGQWTIKDISSGRALRYEGGNALSFDETNTVKQEDALQAFRTFQYEGFWDDLQGGGVAREGVWRGAREQFPNAFLGELKTDLNETRMANITAKRWVCTRIRS